MTELANISTMTSKEIFTTTIENHNGITKSSESVIVSDLNYYDEFKGIYQITSNGFVISKSRKIETRKGIFYTSKRKFLALNLDSQGYYCVGLSSKGTSRTINVHKLMAVTFLNNKPDGSHKLVVNHINGIKTDNRLENLELVSQRINCFKHYSKSTKFSSKYVGVSYCKANKKYESYIKINGKKVFLGYFDIELDAYNTYLTKLNSINH